MDVAWTYNKNSSVIAGISSETKTKLALSVQYQSQTGLNIKADTAIGQSMQVVLTPTT